MTQDTDDPFDLDRFVRAQDTVVDAVKTELAAGAKRSHWMWFVFPQVEGLGLSATSVRYAIRSLVEAKAYVSHPVLGPRLRDCTSLVLAHIGRSAHAIFGSPDDAKFRSSLTLFSVATGDPLFARALDAFFDGQPDPATLSRLRQQGAAI